MERSNRMWVEQLSNDGPDQQAALSDLRNALLRGLRGALASRSIAIDPFVEDAVQESLVRILQRLRQFEGRSRFLTWATAIAIRVAITDLRRRRWKDVSLEDLVGQSDFTPERAVDNGPGPNEQLQRRAIVDKLYGLIRNDLTEKQRAALLAELNGMPQDEIARHLGSNRNAVYKLTHDARKRLKRGLESAGYGVDDINAAFLR